MNTLLSFRLENQFALTLLAFALGMVVALVCTKAARCSRNLTVTLAILPPLVCIALLAVNGSLGTSIAVMGIFALVRFRSAPGTAKDIANVFYAMVAGLLCATGYAFTAAALVVLVGVLYLAVNAVLPADAAQPYELKLLVPESMHFEQVFEGILAAHCKNTELSRVKSTNMGALYELDYLVTLKPEASLQALLDELRTHNGNLNVTICRSSAPADLL